MSEQAGSHLPHHLILEERQHLTLSGVTDVAKYDESAVTVCIEGGTLTVTGDGLQIVRLDVESGDMVLDGRVDGLTYAVSTGRGGIFGRLFR